MKQNEVVVWDNVVRNDNFAYRYTGMRLGSVVTLVFLIISLPIGTIDTKNGYKR